MTRRSSGRLRHVAATLTAVLVAAAIAGCGDHDASPAARSTAPPPPDRIAAIVSLSGERRVDADGDIRGDVSRVPTPVLYLGSRDDPYTDGSRQPCRLAAAALDHARSRFHLVGGSQHGVALLHNAALRTQRIRFPDGHSAAGSR